MADEVQKYLDSGGVSHLYVIIKSKLTNFFEGMFVKKRNDGYDLSQNDFTNEYKKQLDDLKTNPPSTGSVEELLIVEVVLEETSESISISIEEEELDKLRSYDMDKKLYLRIKDTSVYLDFLPMRSGSDNMAFYVLTNENNSMIVIDITLDDGSCEIISESIVNTESLVDIIQDFDSGNISDESVPSVSAVVNFIGSYLGAANGAASLDENGKVPMSQLPSYVDDVVEGYFNEDDKKFYGECNEESGVKTYSNEIEGESSKIYIDLNSSMTYRYGGTVFVPIESFINISPLTNDEIDNIIKNLEEASEWGETDVVSRKIF